MSKEFRLSGKNILLFSNEPWGDVWFSKHHYAIALSQHNEVWFINPAEKWHWKNLFRRKPGIVKIQPGLNSVTYQNIFPKTSSSRFLRSVNERIIAKTICQLMGNKKRVFFSFDPIRFSSPALFNPETAVYYCVDAHEHVAPERELAKNCDLVLIVSEPLREKFTGITTPVKLLPHGIPENPYSLEQRLNPEEKRQAMYMGSIDYRFDFSALHTIATAHPDFTFLIFGFVNRARIGDDDAKVLALCEALPNIRFQGTIPFRKLAPYILESAICLCISKTVRNADTLNSLKILQYLSYGKTVVTNYFHTYEQAPADLLYMADTDDYPSVFASRTDEKSTESQRRMRIEHAMQFSYPRLIESIEFMLNQQSTAE